MLSAWLAATQSERKATTTTTSSPPPRNPLFRSPFGRPWTALYPLGSPFHKSSINTRKKAEKEEKSRRNLGWCRGVGAEGGSLPADTSRFRCPSRPTTGFHAFYQSTLTIFLAFLFLLFFFSRSLLGFVYDFFFCLCSGVGFLFLFGFRFGIGQMYLYLYLYLYMWR